MFKKLAIISFLSYSYRLERMPFRIPVDTTSTAYTIPELVGVISQNYFNRRKLWLNIVHPIAEWLHTAHKFYKVDEKGLYINEHYLLGRLTTVDILRTNENGDYYGKAEETGKMFTLLRRVYANNGFRTVVKETLMSENVGGIESILDGIPINP